MQYCVFFHAWSKGTPFVYLENPFLMHSNLRVISIMITSAVIDKVISIPGGDRFQQKRRHILALRWKRHFWEFYSNCSTLFGIPREVMILLLIIDYYHIYIFIIIISPCHFSNLIILLLISLIVPAVPQSKCG